MTKDNDYFHIFFIFSGVVHVLLLTINFVFNNNDDTKFYELRIKLGVENVALKKSKESTSQKANKNQYNQLTQFTDGYKGGAKAVNKGGNDTDAVDISDLIVNQDYSYNEIIELKHKANNADKGSEGAFDDVDRNTNFEGDVRRVIEKTAEQLILPNEVKDGFSSRNAEKQTQQIGDYGSKIGNVDDKDVDYIIRYEEMLPRWIEQFKVYPKEAQELLIGGNGVVRVTIKRNGKVIKAEIEESTGHDILDEALISMVKNSDPVIPVPTDHLPELNVLTYKIAYGFTPEDNDDEIANND